MMRLLDAKAETRISRILSYLGILLLFNVFTFTLWFCALHSFYSTTVHNYGPWWFSMKNVVEYCVDKLAVYCMIFQTILGGAGRVDPDLPWLFMITPSKKRLVQKADLTRLSQTLQLVPNIHWILVEDSKNISLPIERLLQRSKLRYTHLAATKHLDPAVAGKGRGMVQRNLALQWLRDQYRNSTNRPKGVVYFMDDDNSYDVRLFAFMRQVKRIGVWAVGISGGAYVESPRVYNGSVVGWDVSYGPKRKFATDMAGFAVNLELILNTNASFHKRCQPGFFETCFLSQFHLGLKHLEPFGLEPKPGEVKETYVWHIKTVQPEREKKGRRGSLSGFEV